MEATKGRTAGSKIRTYRELVGSWYELDWLLIHKR